MTTITSDRIAKEPREEVLTVFTVGLFEMANDYIKFSRPEFEVVGGRSTVLNAVLNLMLIRFQAISHQ